MKDIFVDIISQIEPLEDRINKIYTNYIFVHNIDDTPKEPPLSVEETISDIIWEIHWKLIRIRRNAQYEL